VTDSNAGTAMVELVAKLAVGAAPGSIAHDCLVAGAAALGITFAPVDRAGSDAELATFYVAVVTADAAERAVGVLRQCDGVEAVFIKPRGEPPL